MASGEACGNDCPVGAGYCAACGHRLGVAPEEPINVNVHLVDSAFGSCLSCFTTAVAVVVLVFFVLSIFSC